MACIYKSNDFTKDAEGAISFYKALLGSDEAGNTSAYNTCRADGDCTLIPASCSFSDNSLTAVTYNEVAIYYVEGCQETRMCNDKCRCSNSENVPLNTPGSFDYYSTRCVNSKCVITKDAWSEPSQPSSQTESNRSPQSEPVQTQDIVPSGSR